MQKYLIISFFIVSLFCVIYLFKSKFVTTTMQYFPIDEHAIFDDAHTELSFSPEKQKVEWMIHSMSSESAYLRQDISLLYENGKFKGVQNKWEQNQMQLLLSQSYAQKNSSLLQTISFHHGEFHRSTDKINSIQQMTSDQLYFINEINQHSFHFPSSSFEKKWERKLNEITEQQLKYHWNNLIKHFDINEHNYNSVPLTELVQYEHTVLPGRTKEETKKIIGQLWEGIYKNYIVLLHDKENQQSTHYIPLILLHKTDDHLLIVFELNHKKQKLIQKIS